MSIIRVQHIIKEFHRPKPQDGPFGALRTLFTHQTEVTRAVDDVSFSVNEGELLGYIGANGAGKSTMIKMLTGVLSPTSGEVDVAGLVPWKDRERNALNIGVVFGQRTQLWWDLPLIESFKLISKIYRLSSARYRVNLERFVALLDMSTFIATPVRQLSLGQRMRGDLAAALLHDPPIIYLDEPTIGLDVLAKARILSFLEETNRQNGTTIILTTHDLADVEHLCRRILLIDHGRVLYDGPVESFKARHAPQRVLIVQLAPNEMHSADDSAIRMLDAEVIHREGPKIWIQFDPASVPVAALIGAITAHYSVVDLSIKEPKLETVVRQIYEQNRG